MQKKQKRHSRFSKGEFMKALYTCDHCNFSSTDLEKMKAHEAAHQDAEVLANRINGLIAEYNAKHDDAFCIAKYTPNLANKKKPEPAKSANKPAEKPAKKPAGNSPSNNPDTISEFLDAFPVFLCNVANAIDEAFSPFEGGD